MNASLEDIINQFPFNKVHKVMTVLNWEWYEQGVPGVAALITEATRLLRDLEGYPLDATSLACGGFRVTRYLNEEQDWVYTLEFVAVSLSTEEIG